MKDEIEDIDNLIGNFLAGEATDNEQAILGRWISERDENAKYFDQLKLIFEKASSKSFQLHVDADVAWQKVKVQLKQKKAQETKYWNVVKIAAGFMWLGFLAFMFFQNRTKDQHKTLIIKTEAETKQDTLPDGSTAFINKKSSVIFSLDAKKKIRSVKLTGEAFFAVKHDNEKPFVIETDGVIIKDIGTEFNVKAYPEDSTVVVNVSSGEVQFYTNSNPGLNLKAGEKGIYVKSLKEFSRILKRDTNVLAYKTKVLTFANTDLQSVIASLNDVYNAKISITGDAIKKCRLTVNFTNDRLETIIEVIAETLHLSVTKTNDEIVFSGTGCNN